MKKETAAVIYQETIAENIKSLVLRVSFAGEVVPGQFISLYSADKSRMLPRPISICQVNRETGTLRLVYRLAGAGTREFAELVPGDSVEVLGPLGNGFPVEEYKDKNVLLIGGGIGIPPLLQAAYELDHPSFAVGYRSETYLYEDMQAVGNVYVSTEDGSLGTKGNVLDAIREHDVHPDAAFACGPLPMLRALKVWAENENIPLYISMEERMACGIGACLACVCKTTEEDGHSHVKNARICKDGPVFPAKEVDLT